MSTARLALILLFAVCATVTPQASIREATQHYAQLSLAMDHAGIAAMFAPEGELVLQPGQSVRGPAAIDHYLEGFRAFHVRSDVITTDRVDVNGSTAHSEGTYAQRVTLPDGKTVDVHGRYAIEWTEGANGVWLIRSMSTAPAP
jgi:uncharacterized protein (TIGR02246 family)